jgi:hypothetical protein
MNVYFILDRYSNAVKIGKANVITERLPGLQTGNPNLLEVIHSIECESVEHAEQLEKQLHRKYEHYHIRGEWFEYDDAIYEEILVETTNIKSKPRRDPLEIITVEGVKKMFGPENSPRCYFYPHMPAQIKDNFENASTMKTPFRVQKYPTNGKQMLLPYSTKLDRVFISGKKHNENLELNRFLKEEAEKLAEAEREALKEASIYKNYNLLGFFEAS